LKGGGRAPGLVLLLLGFCFLGPLIWRLDPNTIVPDVPLAAPGFTHPLGTDDLGRDQLARLMQGGEATLLVALPGAALAFLMGLGYGLLAGLGPAWMDRALMRLLDAMLALPALLVLLCLASLVPITAPALIVLIGATGRWPGSCATKPSAYATAISCSWPASSAAARFISRAATWCRRWENCWPCKPRFSSATVFWRSRR
jgi:ABC-type dipeptide/oligopeptide/nickel transport system permease subunit